MTLNEICDRHGLTHEGVDFALSQYQKIIFEITHGMLSKLTYDAQFVLQTAQERWCDSCDLKEEQKPVLIPLYRCTAGNEKYLEFKGLLPRISDIYIAPDGNHVAAYFIGKTEPACLLPKDYGRTWRCWDKMPSDEQLKETPWDGD